MNKIKEQLAVSSQQLAVSSQQFNKKVNPANPVILSKLFLFFFFMSVMVNIYSEPAKIAIIGDTEKYQNQVDLLTVELSQDKNVHLLERSDWDYLLREHEISQSNIAQKSIQFGRLLGADGLIIVTEETIKDKKYLLSKLLAVKTGIILDSLVSPIDNKDENFNWSKSIQHRFQSKFNKLRSSQDNIVTVSMLNLRSSLSTPDLLTFEREINAIFAHRLMQEENILVSERWNMAEATFEKHVAGEDESDFKTGTNIIEGSINLKNDNNIEIKLIVRSPDGKKQEIIITDKKENLAEFAEKLTTEFLKVAKVAKKTLRYDRAKEAEEYYKEAQWAFNAGLFERAAQSAESAWALGLRTPEMIYLRITCYMNTAYQIHSQNPYYFSYYEKIETSKNIDAAITALELYKHYFIKNNPAKFLKNRNNKYANYSEYANFSKHIINSSSLLLYLYYEQDLLQKNKYKTQYVRKLIRDIVYKGNIEENIYNNYFAAIHFLPFWFDSIEETKKVYFLLLKIKQKGLFDQPSVIRRSFLGKRTFVHGLKKRVPLFVDWDKNLKNNTTEIYNKNFVNQLINSQNKKLEFDGLLLQETLENQNPILSFLENLINSFMNEILNDKVVLYYDKTTKILTHKTKFSIIIKSLKYAIKENEIKNKYNLKHLLDYIAKYSQNERKEIYSLIIKAEKNVKNIWILKEVKDKIVSLDSSLVEKSKNAIYIEKIIPYTNALYKVFNNEIFFVSLNYNKELIIEKLNTNTFIKNKITSYMIKNNNINISYREKKCFAISSKYIIYANRNIFIYNRKINNWKIINKYNKNWSAISIDDDDIFVGFSNNESNKEYDSGIYKINLTTEESNLICSSRRKIAQTPLDNITPYEIEDIIDIDEIYIMFALSQKYRGRMSSLQDYFIYNKVSHQLKFIHKSSKFLKSNTIQKIKLLKDNRDCFVKLFIKSRHNNILALTIGDYLSVPYQISDLDIKTINMEYDYKKFRSGCLLRKNSIINNNTLLFGYGLIGKIKKATLALINSKEEKYISIFLKKELMNKDFKAWDSDRRLSFTRIGYLNNYLFIKPNISNDYLFFISLDQIKAKFKNTLVAPIISTEKMHFINSTTININDKEGIIKYTLDGSEPTESSLKYSEPFNVDKSCTIKAKSFYPNKYASVTSSLKVNKLPWQESVKMNNPVQGLNYAYAEGQGVKNPTMKNVKYKKVINCNINLDGLTDRKEFFCTEFKGYIYIEKDGLYTFSFKSDWRTTLQIGKTKKKHTTYYGLQETHLYIALRKGYHKLNLQYAHKTESPFIELKYSGPGIEKQEVPASVLFREKLKIIKK